jgi:DNA-binding LacI/PurR family transcriptional regulator
MSATMSEIAQEAEVSVALVSRLLREDPSLRISDHRRRRILRARDELGGLRMQRKRLTRMIVIPVSRQATPQQIQKGMADPLYLYPTFQQTLEKSGFHLHLEPVDCQEIVSSIRSLAASPRRCDGILISTFGVGREISRILAQNRFPHISNDPDAERFDINSVNIHRTEGVRRALEHLKELGHRRIGFLGIRGNYSYASFVAAMAMEGLAIEDALNFWIEQTPHPHLSEVIRQEVSRLVDPWLATLGADSPTALICQNDQFAFGLADAMAQRGLTPGRDLSLVGFDNIEQRRRPPAEHPTLTTIHNPLERRGERMAELLLNQILHGQTQIIHERVPVRLIVRHSTGPCSEMKAN